MVVRAALIVCVTLLALFVADMARAWAQLPERVATHFNGSGNADGWSSKSSFLWGSFAVVAGVGGGLLVLAWFLPRVPVRLLNLPGKDYWLAPERHAASMDWLRVWMLWIGAATMAFLLALFHATLQANFGGEEARLGEWFSVAVVGYLAILLGGTAWLLLRFRRPREAT